MDSEDFKYKFEKGESVYCLSLSKVLIYNRRSTDGVFIECFEYLGNGKKKRRVKFTPDIIPIGVSRKRRIKKAMR
jgi:hypothetical protein